ncbi:MAG: OmpA family protein [Sandaracinaceae bacterium]|nr:OmpA family protein [Sandaracinaceae bacterium]
MATHVVGEVGGWRRIGLLTLLVSGALGSTAHAQAPSEARLRFGGAGGLVASGDQQSVFRLDLPVLSGEIHAGWVAHENVVLEARLGGGAFLSDSLGPGGLLDLGLGLEVGGDVEGTRLWGSAHLGAGVTGDLVRPVLHLAIGIDVAVSPEVGLGPTIEYGHVFEEDGEGSSDDAAWVSIGATLTYRPPTSPSAPPEPPPPPVVHPPRPPRTPPPAPVHPPVEPEVFLDMLDEAAGLEPRELLVPVLFHFDSTELVACSVASLRSLRDHLAEHDEIQVLEIEGHADGSGGDDYNRDLSERRAAAIRDWLVEHGIVPERLRVAARGEASPVETNDDEAGREQNRRARFRVVQER